MEKERKGEGNASKFRKALQFLRGQSKVSFPRPIRGTLQLMQPWIKAHAPSNTADSLLVAQQLPEPEAGKKFLLLKIYTLNLSPLIYKKKKKNTYNLLGEK